jgi:hypothetical protein
LTTFRTKADKYDDFQETENLIRLDEKDPFLVEKMLEFLYTGNYTLRCDTRKSEIPRAAGEEASEMDTEPAREPTVDTPSENDDIDEPAADIEEPTDETAMPAEEDTAERGLGGSR